MPCTVSPGSVCSILSKFSSICIMQNIINLLLRQLFSFNNLNDYIWTNQPFTAAVYLKDTIPSLNYYSYTYTQVSLLYYFKLLFKNITKYKGIVWRHLRKGFILSWLEGWNFNRFILTLLAQKTTYVIHPIKFISQKV